MPDLTITAPIDAVFASADVATFRTNLGLGALATVTPGTGVATAAAIAINTAGGFLTNAGAVTSITGTAGQVTASAGTGAVTLSLPTAVTGVNSLTSATGQALTLATLDSNANIILAPHGTGKIGVGTTSPQQEFTFSGTANVSLLGEQVSADTNAPGFLGLKARGTFGTPDYPQAVDNLLTIGGGGYNGSTLYNYNKALIAMRAAETWTGSTNATEISFNTTPIGSTTRAEVFKMSNTAITSFIELLQNAVTEATIGGAGSIRTNGGIYSAKKIISATDITALGVVELGHASDTTLARVSAGVISVEGATVRTGTVAIADGGTGQTGATAAFDALAPTTTQGDIIYHNGTDNVRLAKGTAAQVLTMNAGATAPEWATGGAGGWTTGILFMGGSTTPQIDNSAAETSVFSGTIPANTLGTAGAVRIDLAGIVKNDSGAGQGYTLRIKYGATTLYADASNATFLTNSAAARAWQMSFLLLSDGTTGTQRVQGSIGPFGAAAAATTGYGDIAGANAAQVLTFGGTSSEDSTGALTLDVTIQLTAANASFEWTTYRAVAVKL
jgi:hypothetical protein